MNPEHIRHSVMTTVERLAFTPPSAPWYCYDTTLNYPFFWNGAAWAALAGVGGAHNLLSVTHSDTAVQAPSAGSLIYGDATPDWNELVHPAVAGRALVTTAANINWELLPNWENILVVAASGGDHTTIAAALAAAASGDIILIMPGNYVGDITLVDGVALFGFGPELTEIQGEITWGNCDEVTLQNLKIYLSESKNGALIGISKSGGSGWLDNVLIDVDNTHATGTAAGVYVTGGTLIVKNCDINAETSAGAGNAYGVFVDAGSVEVWHTRVRGETYDLLNNDTLTVHVADYGTVSGTITELGVHIAWSNDNVTDPPSDAEIDGAFGTPASVGDGFLGVIDDNAAGNNVRLVVAMNGKWFYSAKWTAAV